MKGLRKTLAWCFVGTALLFSWIIIRSVPETSRAFETYSRARAISVPEFTSFALRRLLSSVITYVATPLALVALFAAAAWAAFKERRSARYWGAVASLIYLLLGLPMFLWFRSLDSPALILMALGISGIATFLRNRPVEKPASPACNRGSRTHAVLNKLVWIGSAAFGYWAFTWLFHWETDHGLAHDAGLVFSCELFLISMLVIAIHECGHALAGKVLGMKLLCIFIGPIGWRLHYGKWRFTFRPRCLLTFVGFTLVAPVSLDKFRRRKILQIAGGPVANLLTGSIATAALFTAPGHPWQHSDDALAIFSTISILAFAFSFVPYRIRSGFSDGAKIYQLLLGGLWADYHRSIAAVYSSLICSRRPRDYDVEAMQRAAGKIVHGYDELVLHIFVYEFHCDRGEFAEASQALARAEEIYDKTTLSLERSTHGAFIFGSAFLNRDPVATRLWWDRMEAKKSEPPDEDRWVAYTSLLWMEGRLVEAREALEKAETWTRRLPCVGAYEAERHALALLRKALEESIARTDERNQDDFGNERMVSPAAGEI